MWDTRGEAGIRIRHDPEGLAAVAGFDGESEGVESKGDSEELRESA